MISNPSKYDSFYKHRRPCRVSTTQTYFTHATLGPAFMSHAMAITHNTTGFSITTLREVTKTQIQALQITIGRATNSLPMLQQMGVQP